MGVKSSRLVGLDQREPCPRCPCSGHQSALRDALLAHEDCQGSASPALRPGREDSDPAARDPPQQRAGRQASLVSGSLSLRLAGLRRNTPTRTPREHPHPGRERRWAGVTQSSPAPYPSCQPLPASLFGHSPGCPLPFLTWSGGPLADPQPWPWLHEWPRSSSAV